MYTLHHKGEFDYIEEGNKEAPVLLLLHGLFGALSNWQGVVEEFSKDHRVLIPVLPIYTMPIREADLEGLREFVERFVETLSLTKFHVLGNSLGGHIALLYILNHPEKVEKLVLTGSSGLFEEGMGSSYPKRGNYNFVKERVEYTFFNPKVATQELIEGIFEVTNNVGKCLRIISIAKSAQRNNMAEELHKINHETLLVWGLNDTITPPKVAHEFLQRLPNAKIAFIDECCHAPMMEKPQEFNEYVRRFL